MTAGDARIFVPDPSGTAAVRGFAADDEVLVEASPGSVVQGSLEELELGALEGRRAASGEDTSIAIVELAEGAGHALALRRRAAAQGTSGAAGACRWDHTSLAVADLDAALRFYRDGLGFELVFAERGMSRQIRSITGVEGTTCELAQLRAPLSGHVLELIAFHSVPVERADWAPTEPGRGHVAFAVEDLDRALAFVRMAGGRVLGSVTQFEAGAAAYCREPSGSFLELSEARAP